MSKASVLALVDDLALGTSIGGLTSEYYDNVAIERTQWIGQADIPGLQGQETYTVPITVKNIQGIWWDGRWLYPTTIRELDAHSRNWRSEEGSPRVWTEEDDAELTFRLYPTPDAAGTIKVLFTEIRTDPMPNWIELAVAWDVLAREMSRDSDHRDVEMAGVARRLAAMLYQMVEVQGGTRHRDWMPR